MKGTLQNTEEQPITKHSGLELATNLLEVFTIMENWLSHLRCKDYRDGRFCFAECLNSVLKVKVLVGAFNQEKALVGAFSVIKNLRMELFEALGDTASFQLILPSSWETSRVNTLRNL